jgi:hypothetical protein
LTIIVDISIISQGASELPTDRGPFRREVLFSNLVAVRKDGDLFIPLREWMLLTHRQRGKQGVAEYATEEFDNKVANFVAARPSPGLSQKERR